MVDSEKIEWCIRSHSDPVVTVGDVVEALDADVSDTHVRQQMRVLEAADRLGSKDVGARAVAWWHTDRVTGTSERPGDHPDQTALAEADSQEQADVAALDPPGNERRVEQRREAARLAIEFLQEHGEARASEIREYVHERESGGYDTPMSLWKNWLSDALGELESAELIDGHSGTWAAR